VYILLILSVLFLVKDVIVDTLLSSFGSMHVSVVGNSFRQSLKETSSQVNLQCPDEVFLV